MTSVLRSVVAQHAEEAARLAETRTTVVSAPHVRLEALRRFDDRLLAQIDGVRTAGAEGLSSATAIVAESPFGAAFLISAVAVSAGSSHALEEMVRRAGESAPVRRGVAAGLCWSDPAHLRGVVAPLLRSPERAERWIGLSVCASHGVDPGLTSFLRDPDPRVRMRAVRAASQLGAVASVSDVRAALAQSDDSERVVALHSLILLGDTGAIAHLTDRAVPGAEPAPMQAARRAAVQAMTAPSCRDYLHRLKNAGVSGRALAELCGVSGDPSYCVWLIEQMSLPPLARIAGEAFSAMTGVDLRTGMHAERPENFESGPNDDPDDPNVDMDPDDGLPWPDVKKVEAWWQANAGRFQKGTRYFMGQPVTKEHCLHVLETGYQRQRILAAQYLCLLEPGTPLFNTAAPAWRQQRLLAAV